MSADASSVVLILPDDTINTIITKVLDTGSSNVQLLVPDGITQLQSVDNCNTLRQSLDPQVQLMIITSDEQTLQATRECHFETIAVQGAHVTLPGTAPADPSATTAPHKKYTPPEPPAPAAPAAPAAEPDDYDPFAAELDSLGDIMSGDVMPEGYDDFAAELDDLGDTLSGASAASSRGGGDAGDYDPFAELDDLGAAMESASGGSKPSAASAGGGAAAPAPRKRIRPEDIVLSDEEISSASSISAGGGRKAESSSEKKKKAKSSKESRERESKEMGGKRDAGHESPISLSMILAVILIPTVVVIAAVLWFGRTTVVIAPPMISAGEDVPFVGVSVPVAAPGQEGLQTAAVQAQRLEAVIAATEQGQVQGGVESPGATAQGAVTLLNQGMQQVSLPAGTEFIGTNLQGQEVRFVSNADVIVPPASTVQQGRQIITTLGETQATITARSAGSASNIEANAITHIALPGQEPFAVNTGSFILEHGPISGGGEEMVHIVKEEDVRPLLEIALTNMDNQARRQMTTLAEGQGLQLEPTTLSPSSALLSANQGYETTVSPEVGQPVADPANPTFSVTVQANYSALATPAGQSLQQQFQDVLPSLMQQTQPITPGMSPAATDWRWDGSTLMVDGVWQPPAQASTLSNQARATIMRSLKGKSIEAARAQLEQYKEQGVIGGYMLPDKKAIPAWDFLVTLKVVAASP